MKCPHCGHDVQYLPRMTGEVKLKTGALLMSLEAFVKENGKAISGRQLSELIRDSAAMLGMMPYEMQTPRLFVQRWGVLAHSTNGIGGKVRQLWEIDMSRVDEARKAVA